MAGAATFATRLAERAVLPSPGTFSAYATSGHERGPARLARAGPLPRLRRVLPQLPTPRSRLPRGPREARWLRGVRDPGQWGRAVRLRLMLKPAAPSQAEPRQA